VFVLWLFLFFCFCCFFFFGLFAFGVGGFGGLFFLGFRFSFSLCVCALAFFVCGFLFPRGSSFSVYPCHLQEPMIHNTCAVLQNRIGSL